MKQSAAVFFLILLVPTIIDAYSKYDGSRTNLRTNGTLTLAGIFPIFCYGEKYRDCTHLQPLYVLQVEAFLWAINQVNARFKTLGYNFTIGAWIKDSCDNGVTGLQQSLDFMKGQLLQDYGDGVCNSLNIAKDNEVIYGMTGAVTSVVSKRVAPVLEIFCLPLISSYATSPELSNNNIYPFFLRTVPEDVYQSRAVFELIRNQNWTLVSIIYEHTTYGDHFDNELLGLIKNSLNSSKICVENNIGVIIEKPEWDDALGPLWDGKARVVVLILDFSIARQFFVAVKQKFRHTGDDVHKFQWIGTDGWSRTTTVISDAEEIAERCITIEPLSFEVPEFTKHLNNLTVSNIRRSTNWELLTKVLEHEHNNCCMNLISSSCHGNQTLCPNDTKITPSDAAIGRAHFVIESVKAFAEVFEKLLNDTCSSPYPSECQADSININGSQLFDLLQNVSIQIVPTRIFSFFGSNKNNGPPVYSYFQRQETNGSRNWQHLGEVSFEDWNHTDLKFNETLMMTPFPYKEIQEVRDNCTPICARNERKVNEPVSCCWTCEACETAASIIKNVDNTERCQPCPDLYSPDETYRECIPEKPLFPDFIEMQWKILVITSMIGLTCTLVIGAIFWKKFKTPLVQLRVPVMLALLLLLNALIFVSPILFLLRPSKVTCTIHWSLVGTIYTAAIASLAAMAQRLVNFSGLRFLDVKLFNINWRTMALQVCLICAGEVILVIIWVLMRLQVKALLPMRDNATGRTFIMCSELDEKLSLVLFVLPLLLSVFVPVYLFKKSHPRTVYATMESRQIILACITVLCLFILATPVALFVSRFQTKVTLHIVAVIAGAYALLLTMHVPNAFLILFNAKLNTMHRLAVARVTYNTWRRLKRENIIFEQCLGQGHYGDAWKAKLHLQIHELGNQMSQQDVVVKVLKEGSSDRKETEFRDEALLMSKLEHKNIIHLVGICMTEKPMLLVIEFMNGGSLEKYLRMPEVQGNRQVCNLCDLHHMLIDVAKACQYLESEGYIHRDIAARNCLVQLVGTSLKPKCTKLGDFGIAKDARSASGTEIDDEERASLPVAWTAPEGFEGRFSSKSDAWSFGVVIWEVFSWGSIPFGKCYANRHSCAGQQLTNEEIEFAVRERGEKLSDYPDPCQSPIPPSIQEMMEKCWQFLPEARPSFKHILTWLGRARNEIFLLNREYCSRETEQIRNAAFPENPNQADPRDAQQRNMYMTERDPQSLATDQGNTVIHF